MTEVEQPTHGRWPSTFRALHQHDFRLYWFGSIIALSGSWIQITTLNWLIYDLTDSALMLGLANFVAVLPVGLLSPIAGVLGDYVAPRKLLFIMRSIRALVALVVALLVLSGWIQFWHILLLMFIGAATDTTELPARYVLLTDFVAERDLSNAIGLNAGAINLGALVGPAVAGLIIGWMNEGIALLVACAFNVIFVVFLLAMERKPWARQLSDLKVRQSFVDGIRYMWQDANLRGLLMLLAVFSFLAQPYIILLPVFAGDVLQTNARGYGLLMSSVGASSLLGTLVVASLRIGSRGRWLVGGGIVFSLSLILFSVTNWLPASVSALTVVGIGQVTVNVLGRALSQTNAPKEFRGRVASFFSLFNNGMARLGGLQASALAQYVSVPFALQVGAILCLVWVLLTAWRLPSLRRLE